MWYTYILHCADDTFYCGVTTDISRRLEEHNISEKGAKYTRARRPVILIWQQEFSSRSEACKEESRIKKLSRKQKELLLKKTEKSVG